MNLRLTLIVSLENFASFDLKKQAISNICAEMFEVFPNDVKKLQKMYWSLNNILGLYESDNAYPYVMSLLACFTRLKLN